MYQVAPRTRDRPGVPAGQEPGAFVVGPVGGVGQVQSDTPGGGAPAPPWRSARGGCAPPMRRTCSISGGGAGAGRRHARPWGFARLGLDVPRSLGGAVLRSVALRRAPPGHRRRIRRGQRSAGDGGRRSAGRPGPSAYERMVAEFAGTVADGLSHGLGIGHGLRLQRLPGSAGAAHQCLRTDRLKTPGHRAHGPTHRSVPRTPVVEGVHDARPSRRSAACVSLVLVEGGMSSLASESVTRQFSGRESGGR